MRPGGAGRRSGWATGITAGAAYFGVAFALGFLLGVIRTLLIVPRTGELVAVALELPRMVGASWIACGWALRRFAVPSDIGSRLAMGGTAFALLLGAELLVSVLIAGRGLGDHAALYRTAPVLLGLMGQLAYGAFPLFRLR
ncbi:MAG: hypothetical protein Q8S27_08125 [Hoeflea sp.]|nr:hypothetical protein [Hoeflea sp.]